MSNINRDFYPTYHLQALKPEDITDENFEAVVNWLFDEQLNAAGRQFLDAATYGWGDDDTDYLTTAIDVTKKLLDLAYEGNRDDLLRFLYTHRDDCGDHWSLHYLDSAGGLASPLSLISNYVEGDED
jgi:hypothetical protein